jgi:tRNA pseudouridine38-40 synthase
VAARTLKIALAYDGRDFVGWQRQARGASVQGLIEEALSAIDGRPVAAVGAGRTDAGVHAMGQVASARITSDLDPSAICRALNARLPASVRALAVEDAPPGFNARFDATSKTYRYRIVNAETCSPFDAGYAWHVRQPLDLEAVSAAAALVEGEHDFAAFQGRRTAITSTVRRVTRSIVQAGRNDRDRSYLHELSARMVEYEIAGTGFLRHMVRTIVGTLVDVGHGRRPPEAMRAILESRDRGQAGPTAPAAGLYLVQVEFGGSDERGQGEADADA